MKKEHRIITCASYGGTGSSAITDLLKEFESCKSFGDYEFTFLHYPNGIKDLESNIINFNRLNTGYAIYNFERKIENIKGNYSLKISNKFGEYSREYIESLVKVRWKGTSELYTVSEGIIEKLKRKLLNGVVRKKEGLFYVKKDYPMYCSNISRDYFLKQTKSYLKKLFDSADREFKYKNLVFDQLVPSSNISKYLDYFEDIKVIVVDRDPRDLYILNKKFWKEGWIPEDINIFIEWFKEMRKYESNEIENGKQILRIKFEDMIYKYNESLNKISGFLELNINEHVNPKQFFNPDKSINNTRLWRKHNEFEKEIHLIEVELSKWIYDVEEL